MGGVAGFFRGAPPTRYFCRAFGVPVQTSQERPGNRLKKKTTLLQRLPRLRLLSSLLNLLLLIPELVQLLTPDPSRIRMHYTPEHCNLFSGGFNLHLGVENATMFQVGKQHGDLLRSPAPAGAFFSPGRLKNSEDPKPPAPPAPGKTAFVETRSGKPRAGGHFFLASQRGHVSPGKQDPCVCTVNPGFNRPQIKTESKHSPWLRLEGEGKNKMLAVKWGFEPLNHNKQKRKMCPNDNLVSSLPEWIGRRLKKNAASH